MDAFNKAKDVFLDKLPENIAKDIVTQIAIKINDKIDNTLKDVNFANVITEQITKTISETNFNELASNIIDNNTFKIIAADKDNSNLLQKATIQSS